MKREKLSKAALEAGFESLKPSLTLRAPFFFLAVLFVLFDLELVLVFPGIVLDVKSYYFLEVWGISFRVILLTLVLEWSWFGLKWQI